MLSAAALMPAAGYGQVNEIAAAFTSPFEDRVSLAPSSWGTPRPVFHSGATLAANNNCTFSATQSANLGSSGTHSDASDTFGVIEPPIGSGSAASITITFGVPIVAFGGLWGAVTTGGSPGAAQITVQFFDAANT
ncbi:MAG TPA: hypothetical protein VGR78_10965, partial [Verrucomicrobiae bacterium]|nr:hypothetical protein [Verrucomicrobiae bacterium]